MITSQFDDIRPYYDEEIPAAMQRIASNDAFPLLASYVFPGTDIEKVRRQIRSYKNVRDFQFEVMSKVNEQVIARSMTSFDYHGIENIKPMEKYLFVSNHRDIMLDASLLQYVLYKNGHETSEITFGANLMQGQLVTDIGKSNKMFKVERPGNSPREFYQSSLHLSSYIRYAITRKHQSVWIAQRNGRTKDGRDQTDQGLVKMFGMSCKGNMIDALDELHILPVAISYEIESCDILKALELYASREATYVKKPGEDLNSILTGIVQPKGRVHMELCKEISREELAQVARCSPNEFHRNVATLIDERIVSAYKLFANNYIAHDIRDGKDEFRQYYTDEQLNTFRQRLHSLQQYKEQCDINTLNRIFLGIYANPIDVKRNIEQNKK